MLPFLHDALIGGKRAESCAHIVMFIAPSIDDFYNYFFFIERNVFFYFVIQFHVSRKFH